MVMHARKTQRIGDGYFEKHQTHPYQNSKYSSKGSYERERMRDRDSPNGNSYRSDSPECDSPRDRSSSYHSKSLYVSKTREKERENRDYKSRDKYSDCVNRSPKDKRMRESRETEHRTNHDRNSAEKSDSHALKVSQNSRDSQRKLSANCQQQDKRDERDRVVRCGDWSEHLSSSGKKYYYNCKTEVSQWEKPREWLDPRNPSQRHPSYQPSSLQQNRTVAVLDKHSVTNQQQQRKPVMGGRVEKLPPSSTSSSSYWPHDSSSSSSKPNTDLPNNSGVMDGQATDMEICSGDSTPTSETSCGGTQEGANAPGPPQQQPLHVDTHVLSSAAVDPGPPTPTHSETQDCTDARKLTSPPPSSLLSSGTALAGLRPQAPNLTPSLVNHYRDDLVNHVRGWQADMLEKQAQKLSEEAHSLGSMCTRVSAELKCARSVVRLTEIQATLQEQRVLFLRQQIKNLEELKSQNSFMADEP